MQSHPTDNAPLTEYLATLTDLITPLPPHSLKVPDIITYYKIDKNYMLLVYYNLLL